MYNVYYLGASYFQVSGRADAQILKSKFKDKYKGVNGLVFKYRQSPYMISVQVYLNRILIDNFNAVKAERDIYPGFRRKVPGAFRVPGVCYC